MTKPAILVLFLQRGRLLLLLAICAGFFPGRGFSSQGFAHRLEEQARWLAAQNIGYSRSWVPPGETVAWPMDCSNTARYFYRTMWGRDLPRTASAQYEFFRKQGKFRKAPANSRHLAKRLRPGDFLFWTHTYKPKRKPPVTHVMVYLGRDASGTMWMAGAQGSRGVDVYRFRPESSMGGYRWFLWFRREGKFLGYARP